MDVRIKLKHLDMLTSKDNKENIFEIVLGIKNTFMNRIRYSKSIFVFTYNLKEFFKIEPREVEYRECGIKVPSNIDGISIENMLSLKNLTMGDSMQDHILETVYHACIEENADVQELRNKILDEEFLLVIGIYNKVIKEVDQSVQNWNERFSSVEVQDGDYSAANGEILSKFGALNDIKQVCADFNLSYSEAWKLPYSIMMTNRYALSSAHFVQDNLRKIKEKKMTSARTNG